MVWQNPSRICKSTTTTHNKKMENLTSTKSQPKDKRLMSFVPIKACSCLYQGVDFVHFDRRRWCSKESRLQCCTNWIFSAWNSIPPFQHKQTRSKKTHCNPSKGNKSFKIDLVASNPQLEKHIFSKKTFSKLPSSIAFNRMRTNGIHTHTKIWQKLWFPYWGESGCRRAAGYLCRDEKQKTLICRPIEQLFYNKDAITSAPCDAITENLLPRLLLLKAVSWSF